MRPVSLLSSLLLATQRTRASMPHRGSKETILSESRDVAKRKKDSMTAIFPLYCKIICKTKTGNVLLSQAASHQVSSALRSLTTVFEMGTGVTSSLLSPDFLLVKFTYHFVATRSLRYSHTLVCSVPRNSCALCYANFPAQFLCFRALAFAKSPAQFQYFVP